MKMKDSSVKRSATRAALLDAFERLLAREGLGACTSTAIAAEADLAAGTFYTYFRDRSEALGALFDDRLGVIVGGVSGVLTADRLLDVGLRATLDAAVGETVAGYRKHAAVLRAALTVLHNDERIRAVYWRRHADSALIVRQFLRRAAAAGMVRRDRHRAIAQTLLLTLQGLNSPIVLNSPDPRLVAGIRRCTTDMLVALLAVPDS